MIVEHVERARAYARSLGWVVPGADLEDFEAEALLALCLCARTYRPERGAFWPYAKTAIRNHLIWLLRESQMAKRQSFTDAARYGVDDDGELLELVSLLEDRRADVPRLAAARERLRAVLEVPLTELEHRAVFGQALGYRYDELSAGDGQLDTSRPARYPTGQMRYRDVDNAAQRGLKKLRAAA